MPQAAGSQASASGQGYTSPFHRMGKVVSMDEGRPRLPGGREEVPEVPLAWTDSVSPGGDVPAKMVRNPSLSIVTSPSKVFGFKRSMSLSAMNAYEDSQSTTSRSSDATVEPHSSRTKSHKNLRHRIKDKIRGKKTKAPNNPRRSHSGDDMLRVSREGLAKRSGSPAKLPHMIVSEDLNSTAAIDWERFGRRAGDKKDKWWSRSGKSVLSRGGDSTGPLVTASTWSPEDSASVHTEASAALLSVRAEVAKSDERPSESRLGRKPQLDPLSPTPNGAKGIAQKYFGLPSTPPLPPTSSNQSLAGSAANQDMGSDSSRDGTSLLVRTRSMSSPGDYTQAAGSPSAPSSPPQPHMFSVLTKAMHDTDSVSSSSSSSPTDENRPDSPELKIASVKSKFGRLLGRNSVKPRKSEPGSQVENPAAAFAMPAQYEGAVASAATFADTELYARGSPLEEAGMVAAKAHFSMRPSGLLDPALCFGLSRANSAVNKISSVDDEVVEESHTGTEDIPTGPMVTRVKLPQCHTLAPGAVGLKNLGNTCFINVALQCLLHTPHMLPSVLPPEELRELEGIMKARRERQAAEAALKAQQSSLTSSLRALKPKKKDKEKAKEAAAKESNEDSPTAQEAEAPTQGADESAEANAPVDQAEHEDGDGDTVDSPDSVVRISTEDRIGPEEPGEIEAEEGPEESEDCEASKPEEEGDCILEEASAVSVALPDPTADSQSSDVNPDEATSQSEGEANGDGAATEEKGEGEENATKADDGGGSEENGEEKEKEDETPKPVPKPRPEFVKGSMAAEFKRILKAFTLAQTKSIDPTELIKVIETHPFGAEFCDGGQHDCQEIMRVLMDSLHEDLNRAQKLKDLPDPDEKDITEFEKAERCWQRYLDFDSSPITDLYCGQLQSSVTCHKCNSRVTTYEPFWDLSLPISKDTMAKKGGLSAWFSSGDPSLEDCLRAFTADEILTGDEGYHCETCQEVTTATKRLRVHRFPNTLILHFKRFKCTATSREKITNSVYFPATDLRLHEFATEESGYRKGDASYDLTGLCNHTGSMRGGHYTSSCKVEDSENASHAWQYFNDETVSKLHASMISSPSAYILFYSLRSEDSASKSKKGKKGKKSKEKEKEARESDSGEKDLAKSKALDELDSPALAATS